MPGSYAVIVDAGFLKAEGARVLGLPRSSLAFDGEACIRWFSTVVRDSRYEQFAPIFATKAFLRVYWYDPSDRRDRAQRAAFDRLADVPGLCLRLGHLHEVRPGWQHPVRKAVQACGVNLVDFEKHFQFRSELEQKGVDALMTLDLVNLSRDRVVDAVLLVSGDRDLEESVRVAQGAGCKVVLVQPPAAGVAPALLRLADARIRIEPDDLRTMLVPVQSPASESPALAGAGVRSAQTP